MGAFVAPFTFTTFNHDGDSMLHDEETAPMSPAERRLAIAAILAQAVLRLRDRAALPPANGTQKEPESGQVCLEFAPETVLTVHGG